MSRTSILIHSVDHHTPSVTKDTSGGFSKSYSAATTDIPAFLRSASSSMKEEFNRRNETISHILFFTNSTVFAAINADDRIIYSSGNYRVTSKEDLSNKAEMYRVGLIKEVV